jgi:hypothetical protein
MSDDVYNLAAPFVLHDPDEILTREVFARFGRAYDMGCCLEREVTNALLHLVWREGLQAPMTREQYEESFDKYAKECWDSTFGTLVKKLLSQASIPLEIQDNLKESVRVRNWLAHRFFADHAGDVTIPEGKVSMIKKCDEAFALFVKTDSSLSDYRAPFRAEHLSDEVLREIHDELLEDARKKFQK